MKRVGWVAAGVAAAIVLLLLFRKSEPPMLAFTKVRRETVVSNLPTNGKAEPVEWQSARAGTAGLISSVLVKEGDTVAPGSVIAKITLPGVEEGARGAEARAAQYRSDLDTLRRGGKSEDQAGLDADLAKAKFDRDFAQRDYDSLKRLQEKQAATNVEVIMAKQRLDAAELAIRNLTQRRLALVSPADVAGGRARLTGAEAEAQAAKAKLANGVVRAPIAGAVYSLPARAGNYVETGALIANVGNLDEMRVKVFIDEPDLGRIRVGLPVRITWEGLPGRVWDGSVERLPTEVVPLGSRQVGEVWVTINNSQHDLVPGTTVNAEVRTNVARDALVLPKTALRRDRGPVGVYVLRNGRLAWQPVVTGSSDVSNITILRGLSENERILLPTDTPVKEGDRARVLLQ